jgi:hypothetical protein
MGAAASLATEANADLAHTMHLKVKAQGAPDKVFRSWDRNLQNFIDEQAFREGAKLAGFQGDRELNASSVKKLMSLIPSATPGRIKQDEWVAYFSSCAPLAIAPEGAMEDDGDDEDDVDWKDVLWGGKRAPLPDPVLAVAKAVDQGHLAVDALAENGAKNLIEFGKKNARSAAMPEGVNQVGIAMLILLRNEAADGNISWGNMKTLLNKVGLPPQLRHNYVRFTTLHGHRPRSESSRSCGPSIWWTACPSGPPPGP